MNNKVKIYYCIRNPGSGHPIPSLRKASKRGLDLFCCAMAIPVFGPVCLFIAWRIRSEDGGDVFFFQERIGQGGKPFLCAKFRTMSQGRGVATDRLAARRQSFQGDVGIIILSLLINIIGKTRFRKIRLQLIAFCRKAKNSNEN